MEKSLLLAQHGQRLIHVRRGHGRLGLVLFARGDELRILREQLRDRAVVLLARRGRGRGVRCVPQLLGLEAHVLLACLLHLGGANRVHVGIADADVPRADAHRA